VAEAAAAGTFVKQEKRKKSKKNFSPSNRGADIEFKGFSEVTFYLFYYNP